MSGCGCLGGDVGGDGGDKGEVEFLGEGIEDGIGFRVAGFDVEVGVVQEASIG